MRGLKAWSAAAAASPMRHAIVLIFLAFGGCSSTLLLTSPAPENEDPALSYSAANLTSLSVSPSKGIKAVAVLGSARRRE